MVVMKEEVNPSKISRNRRQGHMVKHEGRKGRGESMAQSLYWGFCRKELAGQVRCAE